MARSISGAGTLCKAMLFGAAALVLLSSALLGAQEDAKYGWQRQEARVDPKGDLIWNPCPFELQKGSSVRYIDFDGGSDENDGLSTSTPWKHHPWDAAVAGKAKGSVGPITYIFKGGLWYRGALVAREAGTAAEPIRLTRDPNWGQGPATICGSRRVSGWKKGADNKLIPEPEKVWYADLDFVPRCMWQVSADDSVRRIPLARVPKWKVSDPADVLSEWWVWDTPDIQGRGAGGFRAEGPSPATRAASGPGANPTGAEATRPAGLGPGARRGMTPASVPARFLINDPNGERMLLGTDALHIKGDPNYFLGATVRTEWGQVMSSPYPTKVVAVDLERNALGFGVFFGYALKDYAKQIVHRYNRYYLEDKPQYLSDPEGEFWFEQKGEGGRLYLRPPGDVDPATLHLEAGKECTLIDSTRLDHVAISGLRFRFTNSPAINYWQYVYLRLEQANACVKVFGSAHDVTISNCQFEYVNQGVDFSTNGKDDVIDGIEVRDNDFQFTDDGAIRFVEDWERGAIVPEFGLVGDVKILRNRGHYMGLRPRRGEFGMAIEVRYAQTLEVAGNILDHCYGSGIYVCGGKQHMLLGERPFVRILIHHNKAVETLLSENDWGGIETWQGGPAYVYDNISGAPRGYRHDVWMADGDPSFAHAFYLDGAFKNYHFNNIAWGKCKDGNSPLGTCAAFQEVISYQNTFFNNTVYNFMIGSRRQGPQAGRDKFLGNIWDSLGVQVFRHSDGRGGVVPLAYAPLPGATTSRATSPATTPTSAPARRGGYGGPYALETNAFGGNVFHDVASYGNYDTAGRRNARFADMQAMLKETKAMVPDLGAETAAPVLTDPANKDFRPLPGSAATGLGVKVFVPWALSAVVGEWNFYPVGNDPTKLLDEHWYMADYYGTRDDYHLRPTFALKGVNISAADYVSGPLEDWIHGALALNGKDQYAVAKNDDMTKPFEFRVQAMYPRSMQETRRAEGEQIKSPQVFTSSLVIELYFKSGPTKLPAVLVQKMDGAGYALSLDAAGHACFEVRGKGTTASVVSQAKLDNGQWHHLLVEADRKAKKLNVFADGKLDASAMGIDSNVSLENPGDLYVGGTPDGKCLAGTLEFLRLAQGSLADAKTTVEELYAWEFHGPFLRDFAGLAPKPGTPRDAGAIQGGG